MKTIFFHDHIITEKDGVLYSTGGLNQKAIGRYMKISKEFSLGTRSDSKRSTKNLSFIARTKNVKHISIPNLSSFQPRNYKKAWQIISQSIDENNFIIVRLPSITGFIAACLAAKKDKNYAIELVGCPWDAFWNYGSMRGKIIAGPFYLITKYFVRRTKNILYVTTHYLQRRYPSNASNVTNCSNVELISNESAIEKRLNKIQNIGNGPVILGMMGSLEAKYKGFDTAIRALHLLKRKGEDNFLLEIVGGGKKDNVQKLINDCGLKSQVVLKGTLPHPEGVFTWLDSVDVFMQPSRVEGLPRALIEAMSRGCVCLGTDIGGIPELLGRGNLHKKNDFKKLSNLIIELRDSNIMIEKAKECFAMAKKFDKKFLDVKREKFYSKSILNINISDL